MKKLIFFAGLLLTFNIFTNAQIAQGGNYTLDQSVTASGGGEASGNNFALTGTFGQPLAGTNSNGGNFVIKSGFWTASPLAPTAASVIIEGRVLTADGQGIRNVSITVIDSSGVIRSAFSTLFGYFKVDNLPSGNVYTITVQAKKYQFDQSSQVVLLMDNISDLNFIALPN
jgi:hypothetical protein